MKIASCVYELEVLSNWNEYKNKIHRLIAETKKQQAQLLLMPEYAGIEIACAQYNTDIELYTALQALIPAYKDFFQNLAIENNLFIQPGTIIEAISDSQYVNRAYFFSPEGKIGYQDKLELTAYEKISGVLMRGQEQKVFDTSIGKIGIAICYDCEFPEIVRSLTMAGVLLVLVPSYTTTIAGYHRVFFSSRARAIENQCYVATAFVHGSVSLSGAVEITYGKAAILSPIDVGFNDDGIVAVTTGESGVTSGTISYEKLSSVRKNGHVHNYEDSVNNIDKSVIAANRQVCIQNF